MESTTSNKPPLPDATRLALERTQLAHERTLMAWVRTATSLISFGFTIYKFFDGVEKKADGSQWFGYRGFSLMMISIGLVCLLMATIQHSRDRATLIEHYKISSRSLSQILAALIFALGTFGFLAVLLQR